MTELTWPTPGGLRGSVGDRSRTNETLDMPLSGFLPTGSVLGCQVDGGWWHPFSHAFILQFWAQAGVFGALTCTPLWRQSVKSVPLWNRELTRALLWSVWSVSSQMFVEWINESGFPCSPSSNSRLWALNVLPRASVSSSVGWGLQPSLHSAMVGCIERQS